MSIEYVTLRYKKLLNVPLHVDVYAPPSASTRAPDSGCLSPSAIPAVVYFHGGGLTVGNRRSWFPTWLQRRVVAAGYAFVSADYQLIPPATGHDVLSDIKDLLDFLVHPEFSARITEAYTAEHDAPSGPSFSIDPEAIAVSGSSSGGLCAYLAAIHCTSPKPKAILSMYGMGGDFFSPHYLTPKIEVFFRARELLDPADFLGYLHPSAQSLPTIVDSPQAYHPDTSPTPGYPSNPRMLLARLYLQLGVYLDYYTGQHEPSISAALREALDPSSTHDEDLFRLQIQSLIPPRDHYSFPQLNATSSWPPTLFLHGSADSAVLLRESQYLHTLLKSVGVETALIVVEGKEHSFDYEAGAEDLYKMEFDAVDAHLGRWLGRAVRSQPVDWSS